MSETLRSISIEAPAPYGGLYHEFERGEWRHADAVAGYSERSDHA